MKSATPAADTARQHEMESLRQQQQQLQQRIQQLEAQQQQEEGQQQQQKQQPVVTDPDAIAAAFSLILGPATGSNSRYVIGECLGSGAFGRVWHVIRRSDNVHFVAKLIELHKMDANAALRARSEVSCLQACDHFGCVGFIEDINIGGNLLIIMEYCDAGDLHFQLKTMRRANGNTPIGFKEREVRLILLQILLSLNHMHRRRMLHRDIKAGNVLLSTAGLVKIGDFGLSRAYNVSIEDTHDNAGTFCGTPDYLAPEVWRRERYGSKADVWSLGIVAYECIVGKRPFSGGDNLRNRVLNEEVDYTPFPPEISSSLRSLIAAMLTKNPAERPSVRDLLDHKYMREDTVASFTRMLEKPNRFDPAVRDFVFVGIDECYSGPSPIMFASPPSFEGPVHKLKDGAFVPRYLVLRNGLLGIFRNQRSSEGVTLNDDNAVRVETFVSVMRVPITPGSNVIPNLFSVDFGGTSNCVWMASDMRDQWVMNLRAAMPRDGPNSPT